MADVIDIGEEDEIRRGMRRRRQRRAKTGQTEKPTSRVLWIVIGSVITIVVLRGIESYFPRPQQQALPPPPPNPEV
jgi:hypothetical protein